MRKVKLIKKNLDISIDMMTFKSLNNRKAIVYTVCLLKSVIVPNNLDGKSYSLISGIYLK